MNAVIYARYSSHNQKEESIEGQLRECHEFAVKNNLTVVHEYCDRALSGKTDKRPQFQKLIKDSEKGKFEAVILYTLDRFARNRYDSAIYKAKLKKNGIKLYYAKQPLPDTPEGIILESVLEGYAEYYSENLARGVKRGMYEKATQCVALGRVPFGYRIGKDKHYEIDPLGAEAVKLIFDKYLQGVSQINILEYINSHEYGRKITPTVLFNILQNIRYTGVYKHGEVVIDGGIPAIIPKDKFERVQQIMEKNKLRRGKGKAKVDYFLSGKAFCGICKEPLIADSGHSKNGTVHHYYKCRSRKKGHGCIKQTERKEWLERVVVDETVKHVLTDKNIELISDRVMALVIKSIDDNSTLTALEAMLKDVNNKIDNIINAIEQGIFTSTTRSRLDDLESQKEQLELQIEEASEIKPTISKDQIVFWLKSFQNGDVDSPEYQKKIIDTLVSSVYVYDHGDGGRKVVINFNLTDSESAIYECSDIGTIGVPISQNPNISAYATECGFFLVIKIEGVN